MTSTPIAGPAGQRHQLREAVGTDEHGRPRFILGHAELRAMIGNFSIGRLVAFPGLGIDRATVARVTRSATP